MAQQIQLRNDTTAGWDASNPILAQGEFGYNLTTKEFKIGDGTSTWSELTYFSSGSTSLALPLSIKDVDGNDLIAFEKGGTGVARIHAVQDDLALRSARDILLYAGDDGPGKVYIGWGDANYTPTASNEVATLGDVDETITNVIGNSGLNNIKTRIWSYPSSSAVAIMPNTDNESIALKSSDAAAIRWHVRNNGTSVVADAVLRPTSAVVTQGDGNYQVVFTIPEQESVPAVGTDYFYQINCPGNSAYDGGYPAAYATTTTLTFYYETDPGAFDANGAEIYQPSVYSQFEVDSDGAHVKVANWSAGQGSYGYNWTFANDGVLYGPGMGTVLVSGISALSGTDLSINSFGETDKVVISGGGGEFLNNSSVPGNQIATHSYVATAKSTYASVAVYWSEPLTGVLDHVGSLLYASMDGDNPHYLIPSNDVVAFPVGSEIKFATNGTCSWFIDRADINQTTLIGEGSNSYTGENWTFIVPPNSTATLLKVDTERWILSSLRLTD